jgi:hypothetical protein
MVSLTVATGHPSAMVRETAIRGYCPTIIEVPQWRLECLDRWKRQVLRRRRPALLIGGEVWGTHIDFRFRISK